MTDFGIESVVESEGSDDWRDEIDENFLRTFVRFSRANQVSNEAQAVVSLYGYASGLLPEWEDYLGILIRGGTSSGKTHMNREVLKAAFDYADNDDDWLYTTTAGSDKSFIDDDSFDDARIGAFNEFQQLGGELREFLKRIVEDGGYEYSRSQHDDESETGRTTETWEKDPMPVIFSIADENETSVDAEMRSRMVEIQVDEGPEKNKAVHHMKMGKTDIQLPSSDNTYVFEAPTLSYAVKKHIANIPTDTDVVIPTDDGRFDGDTWSVGDVTEPMLNFARSESTRASAALASMVKASALLNYHSREKITDDDGDEYIVAEPQDVGNVLFARRTLMALTHNLTRKKFLVLDGFIEEGAPYNGPDASAHARQMDKNGVVSYIQSRDDIPTFSKSQISDILDQLDEDLVINKQDHPEDARKNIYIYDPSQQFEPPNIYDYYEQFSDVTDPMRDQPIEQTIEQQLRELNATMSAGGATSVETDTSDSQEQESGLSQFDDDDSGDDGELSETAEKVAERLTETMDDTWVPARVIESDDLVVTHMMGISPTGTVDTTLADGTVVDALIPKRDPKYEDREGTIAHPDSDVWPDDYTVSDVNDELDSAIVELRETGVFETESDDAGNVHFTVNV